MVQNWDIYLEPSLQAMQCEPMPYPDEAFIDSSYTIQVVLFVFFHGVKQKPHNSSSNY